MSDGRTEISQVPGPGRKLTSPAVMLASAFAGSLGGSAVAAGVAGLEFRMPAREILVFYVLLECCFLVALPSFYWMMLARGRPDAYAARGSVFAFVFGTGIAFSIVITAVRLGVLPRREALTWELSFTIFVMALVAWATYPLMRAFGKYRWPAGAGRDNSPVTDRGDPN